MGGKLRGSCMPRSIECPEREVRSTRRADQGGIATLTECCALRQNVNRAGHHQYHGDGQPD